MEMDVFEYKEVELPNELKISEKLSAFQSFLDDIWTKYKNEKPEYWRNSFDDTEDNEENNELLNRKHQPFFSFYSNKTFKLKNYIGYIKFEDVSFNLYPKICEKNSEKNVITNVLLLWLKYSKKIFLPNFDTNLDESSCDDFFDCLIYLFAKYTNELFANSLFQHYEEVSEETNFLKGKLNFNEYIKNIAKGKQHKFHCTYDSFEFNNKFNQIVKYTSKMLFNITKSDVNKKLLSEILFTLDSVDDVICTYNDCKQVYINRFLSDFVTILDYCKLFLKNAVTFNSSGEFNNFAFLFRTEVLFEDFITNFAKANIDGVTILDQDKSKLDEDGHFKIKPDLIIKGENEDVVKKIIDIKYKNVKSFGDVSQADIYQCIAYSRKLNCNDVTLLYPMFSNGEEAPKKLNDIKIKFPTSENKEEEMTLSFKFIDCCPCSDKQLEDEIKKQLKAIIFNTNDSCSK